jgi:hypothetical protein
MNDSLVAIPIAAYGKGPVTALVGASEGLLTGVRVRMNAQAGWARECLVARVAGVLFVVLPIGDGTGEWETVVVPGRIDARDKRRRLRWSLLGRRSQARHRRCGRKMVIVVHVVRRGWYAYGRSKGG